MENTYFVWPFIGPNLSHLRSSRTWKQDRHWKFGLPAVLKMLRPSGDPTETGSADFLVDMYWQLDLGLGSEVHSSTRGSNIAIALSAG